jgi:GDP-L-fucose synthase
LNKNSRIFIAGHNGLVGSALVRNLVAKGYTNIVTARKTYLDLRNRDEVEHFISETNPEYVFLAAAKVGGIMANSKHKAEFITDNLQIQTNVIELSYKYGVKKLLFLGSSCIYPKNTSQPIKEDQLLTGLLEPTNDAYAIAKIAGITMCKAYRQQYGFNAISLMPTNLYGPKDNFNVQTSHVLPSMIAKFHYMKKHGYTIDMGGPYYGVVKLWGDGSARREFLHVDDLAEACYICMQNYNEEQHINIGTGVDITIKELAHTVSSIIGFVGDIEWDTTKPNGTPRKVLNVDKIKTLGWAPKINLEEGIEKTYEWFINNR